MKRSDFLKIIGAGALITATGLPAIAVVDKSLNDKNGITTGDPFWHIRELMGESKDGWEYHFSLKDDIFGKEYSVMLLQNGNYHRETWIDRSDVLFREGGVAQGFTKGAQNDCFMRLMHGVENFNSLPTEDQQKIRDWMENHRR